MVEVSGGRHRAPDPPSATDLSVQRVNGTDPRVPRDPLIKPADDPSAPWHVLVPTTERTTETRRLPRHSRTDEAIVEQTPSRPAPSAWSASPESAPRRPFSPPESNPQPPTTARVPDFRPTAPRIDSWSIPATQEPELGSVHSAPQSPQVPRPPQVPRRESVSAPPVAVGPTATPAIEVSGLRKVFGDHVAVDDVSFTVEKGSIFGLLGPNGAGKTTTVNMLCTLLRPDAGTALVNGHDVVHDAAGVRRSIMLTGQFAALDEALTGRENLVLFGRLLGLTKAAAGRRADELLESFELTDAASRRVREYSGGMRRRIDIACGLVTAPQVVFLDEPTTGLDPRSRQEVWRLVESLREQGVTTLLTTQYLEEADVLSDRIVVIDQGRVIANGTATELKASIGTSFYEVTPSNPDELHRVRDILADLGARTTDALDDSGSPTAGLSISVPAPEGANALVEIVRRTTNARLELSDVALRTPTLDEVFLALTAPNGSSPTRDEATVASPVRADAR